MYVSTSILRFVFGLALLCAAASSNAQPSQPPSFSPSDVWTAQLLSGDTESTQPGRTHPGSSYWQNHASYMIEAQLDTDAQRVQGSIKINYTNNSPHPLSSIWLLRNTDDGESVATDSSQILVSDITIHREESSYEPSTFPSGTRIQVQLDQPIEPEGGTTTIRLNFETEINENGLPQRTEMRGGPLYSMGHWFPHVAAYNESHGWATPPSPTHPAYGSIEYSIAVPATYIIAGSGTILNPGDVLTADQRRRLNRARDTRDKVSIITPNEAGSRDTRPTQTGTLTWEFDMNGVRTVAWAASPAFVWNAARIDRTGRRDGLAMSYYPRSSVRGNGWNRSTYHTQKAVQLYTDRLHKYPWTDAINVAAPAGQNAFPGLSMCPAGATGYSLFACSVQNQSKNWFPTIVAGNANRHPWMIDGLATFLSTLAHRTLYDGEFAPKNDEEYAPGADSLPERAMATQMQAEDAAPISAPPAPQATSSPPARHTFKPAFGLHLLREYILEPEQFDYALRQYAQRWEYKQATPHDFFRTIEDATGTDLSWFWRSWFDTTWQIDIAIRKVAYRDEDPTKGARITIGLDEKMPIPVRATVQLADNTRQSVRLPVDIWRDGPTHTFELNTSQPLRRIALDPNGKLPDAVPSNNTWTAETQ